MAINDLLAFIEEQAQERIRASAQDAKMRAEVIEAEALEQAEQQLEQQLSRRRRDCNEQLRREVAVENRASNRELALAREKLIDRVLTRAEVLLRNLPVERVSAAMPGLVRELLPFLPADNVELVVSTDLADSLREATLANRGWRIRPDDEAPRGFVALADGGRVRIDQTLGARLHRARDAMAIDIARQADPTADDGPTENRGSAQDRSPSAPAGADS